MADRWKGSTDPITKYCHMLLEPSDLMERETALEGLVLYLIYAKQLAREATAQEKEAVATAFAKDRLRRQ
jgi:hypothetical protein